MNTPTARRVTLRSARGASAAALVVTAAAASAQRAPLPVGGTVVAGEATIESSAFNTTINTQSMRTIVEFESFDIANSRSVIINQPTASSAFLGRITNGAPTIIEGPLSSNGQVFLINRAGVTFASSTVIDVGRLVASTGNLSNEDFLAGIENFTDINGAIINQSENLFGRDGVVLVAQNVTNNGQIVSDGGAIVLVAGNNVLLQEAPGDQVIIQVEGFGDPRGFVSRLVNNGTVDAGDGQVVLGAGDLLGFTNFNSGSVLGSQITLDTGSVPLVLDINDSTLSSFDQDAAITINTSQLSYFCDEAPNGRLTLNAPGGFVNLSSSGAICGPAVVNGLPGPGGPIFPGGGPGIPPGPGDPGSPGLPGIPGLPGSGLDTTFVDAFARFLPGEPLAAAPANPVGVDAGQIAALERDFEIDIKDPGSQPLLEQLVTATLLNDLATPAVSPGRLNYNDAQAAIDAYGGVFYVDNPDDSADKQDPDAAPFDQTQQVRTQIQRAADRYMADAEVLELVPADFVAWLRVQDPQTLQALAGLDELVNQAMPNMGLGRVELDNFKQWTYGKIAPQGVTLRTLDKLVVAAGRV